jgi:heavy metal translocating P-type ATPase
MFRNSSNEPLLGSPMARDPVCGLRVKPDSPHHAAHGREFYCFCSTGCRDRFVTDPACYLGAQSEAARPQSGVTDVEYACPTHPEFGQRNPGPCPICGMPLEAVHASLAADIPGLHDLSRRFWATLPLSGVLALIAMAEATESMGVAQPWIELLLATPVVLWSGWPLLARGMRSFQLGSPDRWTLVGLGVGVAYGYGVFATLFAPPLFAPLPPDVFSESLRTHYRVGLHFEAAAVIISLTLLGQMLELRANAHADAAAKTLRRLAPSMAEAPSPRAQLQQLADVAAGHVVLGAIALALLTLLGWGFFGPQPRWTNGLANAVAVLIVASPSALTLATPLSLLLATGKAASHGALFRDAAALEALSEVTTLIVGKTGTLTQGRPAFRAVVASAGWREDEVLRIAASLDQGSTHPLAQAIVAEARRRRLRLSAAQNIDSSSGIGVRGGVDGRRVVLGNTALMVEAKAPWQPLADAAETLRLEGASVMYLAVSGQVVGLLAVSDPARPGAAQAIATLRESGVRVVMATSDGTTTAQAVARQVGVDDVYGEVTPQEKEALVGRLQAEGEVVAVAGHGINDALALARAHVRIAMGTTIGSSSAHVTLVKNDLQDAALARLQSLAGVRNMRQNLAFALLYNALGVPLAAGLLYVFTGQPLSPIVAGLAMSLSSLAVVGNALRMQGARL